MERYYSAKQVAQQLSTSTSEAYKIINSVPHLQHPLRVSEAMLKMYVERNTVYPMPKLLKNTQTRRKAQ